MSEIKNNELQKQKISNNSVIQKFILKIKNELEKDEIKKELNNIVLPIYEDIYSKIFPHYITIIILLSVIIFLLLLIITKNIYIINKTNN